MDYNKLVRDKVPEIIKKNGEKPFTHIAEDEEYWEKLKDKLREEINEFLENQTPEELSDILEVVEAISDFKGWKREEIDKIKKQKQEIRGGFKNKIILDKVD